MENKEFEKKKILYKLNKINIEKVPLRLREMYIYLVAFEYYLKFGKRM